MTRQQPQMQVDLNALRLLREQLERMADETQARITRSREAARRMRENCQTIRRIARSESNKKGPAETTEWTKAGELYLPDQGDCSEGVIYEA